VDKIQINCHLLTLELTIEALNTARAEPLRGITGGSSYHRGGPSPGRAWWWDWRPLGGPRGGGLTAPLVVVDCAIGDPSVGRAATRGSQTKRWRWRGRLTGSRRRGDARRRWGWGRGPLVSGYGWSGLSLDLDDAIPAVVLKEEHKGQSNLRDSPRGAYLTEKRGLPMSDLERRRYLDRRRRRGREVQIDLFLRPRLEYEVVSPSDLVGGGKKPNLSATYWPSPASIFCQVPLDHLACTGSYCLFFTL
jgi:hypothetical protein